MAQQNRGMPELSKKALERSHRIRVNIQKKKKHRKVTSQAGSFLRDKFALKLAKIQDLERIPYA